MNDTCYEVKIISLSVNSNVESTDTPSSKIKDKQQYVVFVPPKFFRKSVPMKKAQCTNVYWDVHQEEPQQCVILHSIMLEDISLYVYTHSHS